jgi:hypothetical protein
MKLLTLLGLFAVCLLATTGVSQTPQTRREGKKDEITYDMAHLEKVFGIKFKSAKVQPGKGADGETIIMMTLAFTKDVPEGTNLGDGGKGMPSLRQLFAGKSTMLGMQLQCYLFDEDGVVFTKQAPGKIEGEVTGKEGDAFRISQSVSSEVLAKTKKISFREEQEKK